MSGGEEGVMNVRGGRGHECEGEEGVTSGEEEGVNVRERKGS